MPSPRPKAVLIDEWPQPPGETPWGGTSASQAEAREVAPNGRSFASWAESRAILYDSTDDRGEPRRYSGRVYLPNPWLHRNAKGAPLLVFVHATQAKWDHMPHFNRGLEPLIGALAATLHPFAVAMPDLPGYGQDPSRRPHPHCHAKSLAVSVLDMIQPALALLEAEHLPWDGRVFILGYSAGGYAAMAAVREWHLNPRYQDLPLTAAACMAGAYDLAETIRAQMLGEGPYLNPDLIPMLTMAYHDLYPGAACCRLDQCLNPRLLEVREDGFDQGMVQDWFSGAFSCRAICRKINQRITGSPHTYASVRELTQPHWLETQFRSSAWPHTEAGALLQDNTLVGGWRPRVPLLLATSPTDDCIPPENTLALMRDWAHTGAPAPVTFLPLTVCGRGLTHLTAAVPGLVKAFRWCGRQRHLS